MHQLTRSLRERSDAVLRTGAYLPPTQDVLVDESDDDDEEYSEDYSDGLEDDNRGIERALGYLNGGAKYERDIMLRYAAALYDLHDQQKYRDSVEVYKRVIASSPGRNFVTLKIATDQGLHGIGDATLNGRALLTGAAATARVSGGTVTLGSGADRLGGKRLCAGAHA